MKNERALNNVMSNDGLIIEYMDLSHIHLAVLFVVKNDIILAN